MRILIPLCLAVAMAVSSGAQAGQDMTRPMTPRPSPETSQAAACCKTCRKGKACGDSCIARDKTCHQPPGCACDAAGALPDYLEDLLPARPLANRPAVRLGAT